MEAAHSMGVTHVHIQKCLPSVIKDKNPQVKQYNKTIIHFQVR